MNESGMRKRRWLCAATVLAVGVGVGNGRAATSGASTDADRWKALADRHWVQDGSPGAPRVVYMFTDPNCPFCNKLWNDARPWVNAGKLQIRHLMVGIITPTSEGKSAALLAAKDPASALAAYEAGERRSTDAMIASGRMRPLEATSLQPLSPIPPAIQTELDANARLMADFGFKATPAVVWRGDHGGLETLQGVTPAVEARIFGPR